MAWQPSGMQRGRGPLAALKLRSSLPKCALRVLNPDSTTSRNGQKTHATELGTQR